MAADIPQGLHNLKLGRSFDKKSGESYHTVRYDFKPASLEECKECYVDFGPKSETIISIPKVDNSGEVKDLTLFKGSRKMAQKECLLIYDHETGEFTLEDLSSSIQVKQIRSGEEEKEKNLQYIRNIRSKHNVYHNAATKKTVDHRNHSTIKETTNDLLMSDEEESENSSSSSGEEEAVSNNKTDANNNNDNGKIEVMSDEEASDAGDTSSEEDDIAKSLEAVVATQKISPPNVIVQNLDQSTKASSTPTDYLLHDDLHLSDSSDESE
uniref:Ell-associated factor Eaf n=1 Tax=Romanomermis culicivorax TaxID=13658 RepID=A0A915JCV8_ROMCU